MIIIIVLFCLRWEVVTSWSPMVLQMPVFHVWVAILQTEDLKLCTRMNLKPGSSMLIFWDVNSIWELEGGISDQGKREATEGKTSFSHQDTFLPCCFFRKVPKPARSHGALLDLQGRFLWVFTTSEHQCSAAVPWLWAWFPRELTMVGSSQDQTAPHL